MNKFAEHCRQILNAEDTNLYHFCSIHNLERTGIRRMLSGERLPKPELFQSFVNSLTLTPMELKKLLDLYERQKIGDERFENRIFIKNMLSYIGEIQGFQKKDLEIKIGNWDMPVEQVVPLTNYMEIVYIIQRILQTEKEWIYTNIPMDWSDFFQILQQEFCIRDNQAVLCHFLPVLKKSEITFDVNYNLRLMKSILPFALQEETKYRPYYYYSNFSGRDSVSLYPFYLLSSEYLLLLGENQRTGLLYKNQDVLRMYRQEIMRLRERARPFVFKSENPQGALEYYIKKCVLVSQPVYTLEYFPCIFHGYDKELFYPYLKNKDGQKSSSLIQNAELLVKSIMEYKPYDAFISKEGFDRFADKGELSGQFMEVLNPFPKEVRREILRRITERCREGMYRLHLVPEDFLSPFPKIGLELYENRTIVLISCEEVNSYSILDEKTLFGAFEDYFCSILENPEVTTVEETIQYLEELQRMLE